MLNDFFYQQIRQQIPFDPTAEQASALEKLSEFLFSRERDGVFLLKGYAGTGKSSLAGALVKAMDQLGQKAVLLAPTGRAAKIFAAYSGHPAYTIHKKIYRQQVFSHEPSGFVLADNLQQDTIFFVDEASMISNDGLEGISFGTGRLLNDLIQYVYSGENCRLILLGDTAQLPPVSQSESPALQAGMLSGYGLQVTEITLTQVVRQSEMSGILSNATALRVALETGNVQVFPRLQIGDNVFSIRGDELIACIEEAYYRDGLEETIVITRSNKRASIYNNGIRNRILYREEEISSGDLLLVAKNNYFWGAEQQEIDFIANGDIVEIRRVRKVQELYDFRFCDVTVVMPDYGVELDMKILPDTLHTDAPSLPRETSDKLFQNILADYADIPAMKDKMKKMKSDPYYNAVQVKYAYALTCHKAQGGQWKNVFLDVGYIPEEQLGVDFYRWLYTAFTRAAERIYLVNIPEEFFSS
jgi:exodeoxyribonuclease-5